MVRDTKIFYRIGAWVDGSLSVPILGMKTDLPEHKQPESDNRNAIEGKAEEGGEAKNASSGSREGGH